MTTEEVILNILIALLTSGFFSVIIGIKFERKEHDRKTRLAIYQVIVDLFAEFLDDFTFLFEANKPIPLEKLHAFNKMRMKTYGYLCIYGSQESIDAHEKCIEIIFETIEGKQDYDWNNIRNATMKLLNTFRKDCNLKKPASYNGTR